MKTGIGFSVKQPRLFIVLIVSGLLTATAAAQDWYDSGWLYRVPVTISNPGAALTDFQVQVNLSEGSFEWDHALSGGADIRFTASDGITLVPFWIEEWDDTPDNEHATIWVKVPAIPSGGTFVYLYYGNTVSSASNGFNTFDFFDDFESGTVPDPARWTASGGTWSISPGVTQKNGTSGGVAQGMIPVGEKHLLRSLFSGTDYVVECDGLQTQGRTWGLGVRSTNHQTTYTLSLYEDLDANANYYYYAWLGGPTTNTLYNGALGAIAENTWYTLKVKAHGSSFDLYFEDELKATTTNNLYQSGSIGLFGEYDDKTAEAGIYLYNNVRVRKYASTDPSSTVGTEQDPSKILTVTFNKTDLLCSGYANGSIDISVAGGDGSYNYFWVPGGYVTEDISALSAGTYTVNVDDGNGYSGYQSITILQPEALVVSYAVTSPYNCSTGTATVEITASGGTLPYTGTGTRTQSSLQSVYTVTDANGCQGSISVELEPDGSWYDPAWMYRKPVDVAGGSEPLTDFQVQINLEGATHDHFSQINAGGTDIRFTTQGGTEIPYWIESWDDTPGSEHAVLWVKVPYVPTTGTTIYLYYGNTAAEEASNGDDTFLFFDDFESDRRGYYAFGDASTIMVEESAWGEGTSPHTLSVVKAPETGAFNDYEYYGYYGPQGSGYIGIAGSNDLLSWTRFPYNLPSEPGQDNPLFTGHGERWPSVYWDASASKYFMVHTVSYGNSYIVYRESNDGLSWTSPTTIVPYDVSNQNPSLFHDPVSNHYYLYWLRFENGHSLMYREAETVAGLVDAESQLLINSSSVLAAPQMLYYDNTYFLATEIIPAGIWQVRIYAGSSPRGPFGVLPGNPVLADGCACLFQHLFNGNIYEYYCKETSGTWTLDMRVVDPSTGRIVYENGTLDASKWTPGGGTWVTKSATQHDVSTGDVAEGVLTSRSIQRSSFSGSNYVLEGWGRQIVGVVWGLGIRTQDVNNLYSFNIYDNHNAFYTYEWRNGVATQLGTGTLEAVVQNEWYKVKIVASDENEFDFYFETRPPVTVIDNVSPYFTAGSVALYGEGGTTAQWDEVRVRKYAAIEPSVTGFGTTAYPGQWEGLTSTDWNIPSNWSGGVPVSCSNVTITSGPINQPHITTSLHAVCFDLMITTGSTVTIDAGARLTVGGTLINNGTLIIKSDGLSNNGSLIAGRSSGTGIIIYERFLRPQDNNGDRHFFASPVSGQTIATFKSSNLFGEPAVSKVTNLWEWNELAGDWPDVTMSTGSFIPGKGYNVTQAAGSDGLLKFQGSLVHSASINTTSPYKEGYTDRSTAAAYGVGNETADIWATGRSWTNYGGGGWNLLGNPFTSAMDANLFIANNLIKFDPDYQALYVFDGVAGVYKYSAASVPAYPEEISSHGNYIQAGQGFFVLSLNNNTQFNFSSNMQVHQPGTPILKSARSEDLWPGLQLKVQYGEKASTTLILYHDKMSKTLDPGYDVGQLSTNPDVEIYTALIEKDNGVNFARQALPIAEAETLVVPVGIDAEYGGTVTFSAYTVPLDNKKFWLEDRLNGTFTDLNSNTYTVTLPGKTFGTGRFYIVASANTPTAINRPEEEEYGLRIWPSGDKVIISGETGDHAICEIFDINGKLVIKKLLNDDNLNMIDLPQDLKGVFLVRVTDGFKVTTRKVALL